MRRKLSIVSCAVAALLLNAGATYAASVTVTLGPSSQNLELANAGRDSSGAGLYHVYFGACSLDPQNSYRTICTLSGSFTGTSPGLTNGTYTLTSSGPGNNGWPGIQQPAGSNTWALGFLPPFDYDMTLTLVSSTGTVVASIIQGGVFVAGSTISTAFGSQTVCSGVPTCSVGQVGVTLGATILGPITGSVSFDRTYPYYFPHLAFSGGWQTTLTYINYSPETVTCTTNFYDDTGRQLPIPFSIGQLPRQDTMLPGGSVHEQTVAALNGQLTWGWAQASCTGQVQASLLYRYYQSGTPAGEASVAAATSPATLFVTFAQTATGLAYANPSATQSANVTIKVYNQVGVALATRVITLGPLAHGAGNLGPMLGLSSFTGSVKITSDIPIVSLSINSEAFPSFSSLPAGDLPGGTPVVQ